MNTPTINTAFEDLKTIVKESTIDHNDVHKYNMSLTITDPDSSDIPYDIKEIVTAKLDFYMNGDLSVPPSLRHHYEHLINEIGKVNSNYGWQMKRAMQFDIATEKLLHNPDSLDAYVTIYDGKEQSQHAYDSPNILSIGFQAVNNKLHVNVHIKSFSVHNEFLHESLLILQFSQMVARSLSMRLKQIHFSIDNLTT